MGIILSIAEQRYLKAVLAHDDGLLSPLLQVIILPAVAEKLIQIIPEISGVQVE
jgi:hypothetical protein